MRGQMNYYNPPCVVTTELTTGFFFNYSRNEGLCFHWTKVKKGQIPQHVLITLVWLKTSAVAHRHFEIHMAYMDKHLIWKFRNRCVSNCFHKMKCFYFASVTVEHRRYPLAKGTSWKTIKEALSIYPTIGGSLAPLDSIFVRAKQKKRFSHYMSSWKLNVQILGKILILDWHLSCSLVFFLFSLSRVKTTSIVWFNYKKIAVLHH